MRAQGRRHVMRSGPITALGPHGLTNDTDHNGRCGLVQVILKLLDPI